MNKICTDVKQSKKLIELGININTADMFWDTLFAKSPEAQVNNHHFIDEYDDEHRVPAWSLTALIELIPTNDKKDEYYVNTESHSDYHTVSYRNCWDGCIHSEDSEESLLDAAFEMICWLKENRKI